MPHENDILNLARYIAHRETYDMWWLLIPIIIGIILAATIIDHRQEYSPDKIVLPRSRVAPGVGGPPIPGVYAGYEMMLDEEKVDSGTHFEAIAHEMKELDESDDSRK